MPLKNFEKITHEYSFRELNYYIPLICTTIKTKVGKAYTVSTPQIIQGIHKYEQAEKGKATKLRSERVRMMMRYIIINDLAPGLISTGKGFYIATHKAEMDDCIKSQRERIKAQETKLNAWARQRDTIFVEKVKLFNS